jgi:hypothetical protein
MCTCPLGRSRRPFACSSDARHAHSVFNNRYSYTSSYASARGQSDCQKTTRNGLPKTPILGVSGATNATCCAHARPCGSISISSIHVSLHIAAINFPIGRATWHATWHAPTWQISARVVSTDTIFRLVDGPCRSSSVLSDIGSAESALAVATSSAKSPRLNEQNKYQQHANFPRESETCLTAQLRPKRLHECIGDVDLHGDRQRKIGATGRPRELCWMEALSSRGF